MARFKDVSSSSKRKRASTEVEPSRPKGKIPKWENGKRLSELSKEWRECLYVNKVKEVKKKESLIIAEKKTSLLEFKNYGLTECFERLGWENAITLENYDQEWVYLDDIISWMATLRKLPGKKPPSTTRLVGMVNGQEVELSFKTLDELTDFDTGAINPKRAYEYLSYEELMSESKNKGSNWNEMLQELFAVPSAGLARKDLKPLPKLISSIVMWNINPRTSDKSHIRNSDIRILHALCTGYPTMSFKQLVLHNVWEARESGERKTIPHCKLLSTLLVNAGVIGEKSKLYPSHQLQFCIDRVRADEFSFTKTRNMYVLRDVKGQRTFEVARKELCEEDEEEGNNEGNNEGGNMGQGNLNMEVNESETRVSERSDGYDGWKNFEQWRVQQEEVARQWRAQQEEIAKQWRAQQEEVASKWKQDQQKFFMAILYTLEEEKNNKSEHEENVRCYHDYHAGLHYKQAPTQVNWKALDPFVPGQTAQRYPKSHHTSWLPIPSSIGPQQGEGSSQTTQADPNDLRKVYISAMESLFRPPHPPRNSH